MEIRLPGTGGPDGHAGTTVHIRDLRRSPPPIDAGRSVLVADPRALTLHPGILPALPVITIPSGEAAKSMEALEALYGAFLERDLDRQGLVVAFGGGATCDLAGYAAATWLRGVASDYVPTTLLAMVDASVGGKTGIDFRGRKNLIGAFAPPRQVYMDVAFLDSLPDAEFASGMAEVIKHAVIAGGGLFEFLESMAGSRPRSSAPGGREALERLVADSVGVKAGVVLRDPFEKGERRLLNLGHTFGHGIESTLGLAHGHAVAAGLATAGRLARSRGELDGATLDRILGLLAGFGLPTSIGEAAGPERSGRIDGLRADIAKALVADKKRVASSVSFAMPRAIGRVELVDVALAELEAFAKEAP